LVLETTGSAASTAFCQYLKSHNPDLKLCGHWHVAWVLFWAAWRRLPTVFLWRNHRSYLASMFDRHPHWPTRKWAHSIRWAILMGAAWLVRHRVLRIQYETIVDSPSSVVETVNDRFGLTMVPGDDNLPRIKTRSKQDYESLRTSLRDA
jgi:hypothetical protein